MSTMKMPGFAAEASLYKASRSYRVDSISQPSTAIQPAFFRSEPDPIPWFFHPDPAPWFLNPNPSPWILGDQIHLGQSIYCIGSLCCRCWAGWDWCDCRRLPVVKI